MTTTAPEVSRTAEALARLQRGITELANQHNWRAWLMVQARFQRYSANNAVLIASQRPDASYVAGFKTWLGLNRCVKRGERAIWILTPRTRRQEVDGDPDNTVTVLAGFHAVPVFAYEQTEGQPLPEPVLPALLRGDGPEGVYDQLVQVARWLGFQVEDATFSQPDKNGETDFGQLAIRVHPGRDGMQRCKTLAHELGHACMHQHSTSTRELKELEAESVAFVVCEALGIDSSDYSFGYVVGWSGGGDEAIAGIKASTSHIQQGARLILDRLEQQTSQEVAESELAVAA